MVNRFFFSSDWAAQVGIDLRNKRLPAGMMEHRNRPEGNNNNILLHHNNGTRLLFHFVMKKYRRFRFVFFSKPPFALFYQFCVDSSDFICCSQSFDGIPRLDVDHQWQSSIICGYFLWSWSFLLVSYRERSRERTRTAHVVGGRTFGPGHRRRRGRRQSDAQERCAASCRASGRQRLQVGAVFFPVRSAYLCLRDWKVGSQSKWLIFLFLIIYLWFQYPAEVEFLNVTCKMLFTFIAHERHR